MRLLFLILSVCFELNNCVAQLKEGDWVIKKISTNYVQKGPEDVFELPKNIVGIKVKSLNNKLIFNHDKSGLFCADTLTLGSKIKLKKRKDDDLSVTFPGDELAYLRKLKVPDSCYVSQSFMSLLGNKSDSVFVWQLFSKDALTSCRLFFINNNEMVLFNDNEFLLMNMYKSVTPSKRKK